MLKIAICDDEAIYAEKLDQLITEYMHAHQMEFEIDLYASGIAFTGLGMEMSKYQIIYMDINMEGLNGLQTAAKLREYCKDSFLVFVTAYMEYTLEGYKADAIRYILKNSPQFAAAVEESLDAICKKMNYKPHIETFAFKEGPKKLSLDRIAYIETEVHTLIFHVLEQDYTCYHLRETMGHMENRLAAYGFLRIHQSYMVNHKYIVRLSAYEARLTSGELLPIAKQRFQSVREQFAIYKGEL